MFFDIIRKIPDQNISIIQESPTLLKIKAGKSKYNLSCIEASEFPNLSEGELGAPTEIETEKLSRM